MWCTPNLKSPYNIFTQILVTQSINKHFEIETNTCDCEQEKILTIFKISVCE